MSTLLKLPSQKMLAKYLKHCSEQREDKSSATWQCQLPNLSFPVSASIWIQGVVVDIKNSGSTVVVDDGTGTVTLVQCDSAASKVMTKKGMYIMAVGSLETGGEQPTVKPIKLQDLSESDDVDAMWPLEVLHQINFLNG